MIALFPNNSWQILNESLYLGVLSIVSENVKHRLGQKLFPLFFVSKN